LSAVDYLVNLGLNRNEAKAFDALISIGPSGASDVHKSSDMPRNKAYEALERLAARGMIEVQQGRPTLYRVVDAKAVIKHLIEEYSTGATKAIDFFERKQEQLKADAESELDNTSAWMVRGEVGVKRRLAELIYDAKKDIFAIGGFPPKYPMAVKSAIKAAIKRNVNVRIVSMTRPLEDVQVSPEEKSIVEFRAVNMNPKILQKIDTYDQKLIEGYRSISGYGGMVIIDESTAFDIVDEGKDAKKVVGILFRAPGVPRIQKATVERIIGIFTRKI
jgi:sugar-specific transcriptional regulator TrmB